MKDDLSNKIIGSLEAEGGLPMVVKVCAPAFLVRHETDSLTIVVNELRGFERVTAILGKKSYRKQGGSGGKRWGCRRESSTGP